MHNSFDHCHTCKSNDVHMDTNGFYWVVPVVNGREMVGSAVIMCGWHTGNGEGTVVRKIG